MRGRIDSGTTGRYGRNMHRGNLLLALGAAVALAVTAVGILIFTRGLGPREPLQILGTPVITGVTASGFLVTWRTNMRSAGSLLFRQACDRELHTVVAGSRTASKHDPQSTEYIARADGLVPGTTYVFSVFNTSENGQVRSEEVQLRTARDSSPAAKRPPTLLPSGPLIGVCSASPTLTPHLQITRRSLTGEWCVLERDFTPVEPTRELPGAITPSAGAFFREYQRVHGTRARPERSYDATLTLCNTQRPGRGSECLRLQLPSDAPTWDCVPLTPEYFSAT